MPKKKDRFHAKNARRKKEIDRRIRALEIQDAKQGLLTTKLSTDAANLLGDKGYEMVNNRASQQTDGSFITSVHQEKLEELGITDIDQGTLEISRDKETVSYINSKGNRSQTQSIDEIEIIQPGSKEWEAYVASGGDPNIPEGHVPIRLMTRNKNNSNGHKGTADTKHNHGNIYNSPNELVASLQSGVSPDNRLVLEAKEAFEKISDDVIAKIANQHNAEIQTDLLDQARYRIQSAASLDPQNKILIRTDATDTTLKDAYDMRGLGLSNADPMLLADLLTKSVVAPGIENKDYDIAYSILSDEDSTKRIKFNEAKFPVWEGHSTHPTRNEGFITKAPFEDLALLFDGGVTFPAIEHPTFQMGSQLFTKDDPGMKWAETQDLTRLRTSIIAVAFSSNVQHLLVRDPIEDPTSGSTRAILPKTGAKWKILPPKGTIEEYDGYSSVKNDAITLGYIHWFGLLHNDKTGELVSLINQGAYFDIKTGAIWLPINKLSGFSKHGNMSPKGLQDTFNISPDKQITYLVPAGSQIQADSFKEKDSKELGLNIYEDTPIRVADMFMFIMNYLTSPRMQTEEVQVQRGERRRAQRKGLPPPPPWTVISYKPPSNKKQNSVSTGTGSKHSYVYDVRGHWKNQPCGPRNQQRRLIWVHPHRSGLANETFIPRNRLVQEKEEYED